MSAIIQIELPTETFAQLEKVARQQLRTVDELVRAMIIHELPGLPSLPEDIEAELAAFDHLSDDVLWLLASNVLTLSQQKELAGLNEAAQQRDLTPLESERQQLLIDAYNRALIRRAQAAILLNGRGHNIQELNNFQTG